VVFTIIFVVACFFITYCGMQADDGEWRKLL
jgi:hypothetical protein